jgi:hypothetical protein
MFDTNILMAWIIFGSIWMWFFIYWKKQQKIIPLLSWISLMIYPYFFSNIYYLIWIGIILTIIPFIIKN